MLRGLPAPIQRQKVRAEANISETIRKDWSEAPEQVKQFWPASRKGNQKGRVIPYHQPLARGAM
jgi:hypothetical protein